MSTEKIILVADDDPILNKLLEYKLQKESYGVTCAADGKAALKAYDEHQPDAVLLDIMMPYTDGLQVLKHIRNKDKKLPVIILSAKSRESDIKSALALGANDYFTKPLQTDDLILCLKKLLGDA